MARKPQFRKPFFLRQWREHFNLSQEQLGARLDPELSGASVSRIENGAHNFTREKLEEFAIALNIEVDDLFRDPRKPESQMWRIISGMKPEIREQALRVIKALADEAA